MERLQTCERHGKLVQALLPEHYWQTINANGACVIELPEEDSLLAESSISGVETFVSVFLPSRLSYFCFCIRSLAKLLLDF